MRRSFRLFRLLRAERHVIPGRVIFVRVPSGVSRSRVSRSALARGSEVSLPSVERTAVDFSRGSEVRLPSVGCSAVAKGSFPSPGPKVFPCRGSEVLSTSMVHSALNWGFFVGRCVAFAACVGSDLNGLLRSSGFFRRAMRRSFRLFRHRLERLVIPMRAIFFRTGSLHFLWCLPSWVSGSALARGSEVLLPCVSGSALARGSEVPLPSVVHISPEKGQSLVTFSGTHCVRVGSTVAGSQGPPLPAD